MKKLIFILSVVALMISVSSCKLVHEIKGHSSATLEAPTKITDPVTIVFKIWGFADMATSLVPPTSKLGQFVTETEKYCTIRLTQFPKSANDTAAVTVKCENDSLTNAIAKKFGL